MKTEHLRNLSCVLTGLFAFACAGGSEQNTGPTPMAMVGDVNVAAMIDDLEDGNDEIIKTDERSGSWYTYNDGSSNGSQSPPTGMSFAPTAGGPDGSAYMAHTEGQGFSDWGAGMGLDLNGAETEGETKGTVDASSFAGVTFFARGNVSISVNLMIDEVLSTSLGGACMAADGADCDDAHQVLIDLKDEWIQYSVAFDQVAQAGWGKVVAFDPARLVSIQFGISPSETFDVSIDNVGFYSP